jgi:hypothetical protein
LRGLETGSCHPEGRTQVEVFKNSVLRKIFGPNTDELRGGYIELHNEVLHYFHSSPKIIKMIKSSIMRWVRRVVGMVATKSVYKFSLKSLGSYRCTWEDNTRIDHGGGNFEGCGLISSGYGYGSLFGCCEHVNEPLGSKQ